MIDRENWENWPGDKNRREFWLAVLLQFTSVQQEEMLRAIGDQMLRVKDIASKVNVSHQTCSSQLGKLLQIGLVHNEMMGRESYWRIADHRLMRFLRDEKL